jgi:hypothetical protein
MPTQLEEIGSPVVGAGIEFNLQASSGLNNRTITRQYKMRAEDIGSYIVPLINPTLYDPVYPNAVIVSQRVSPMSGNAVDCVLTRVFAEIPGEYNDFGEMVVQFPGVEKTDFSAGQFAFRTRPITDSVPVRVNRKYYLSNPARIPRVKELVPVDRDGNTTAILGRDTTPSADEYIAMALSSQEYVYKSTVKNWRGDIWVRETIYVRAQ